MHVHTFRRPDDPAFKGKVVLILGLGDSAIDLLYQFFDTKEFGDVGVKTIVMVGDLMLFENENNAWNSLVKLGRIVLKKNTVK